jgi:hypothetical protein
MSQAKIQLLASNGFFYGIVMAVQLVTDRGADEIGSVRIETLLHQKIDLAEIDIAQINRDLLAVSAPRPELMHVLRHSVHPCTIHADGKIRRHKEVSRRSQRPHGLSKKEKRNRVAAALDPPRPPFLTDRFAPRLRLNAA